MDQFKKGDRGSRTPQGVRGLKHDRRLGNVDYLESHSARSAWIETDTGIQAAFTAEVALRKECVD